MCTQWDTFIFGKPWESLAAMLAGNIWGHLTFLPPPVAVAARSSVLAQQLQCRGCGQEHEPCRPPAESEHDAMECAAATSVRIWKAKPQAPTPAAALALAHVRSPHQSPSFHICWLMLQQALKSSTTGAVSIEKWPKCQHCSRDTAPIVLLPSSSNSLVHLEKQQGILYAERCWFSWKSTSWCGCKAPRYEAPRLLGFAPNKIPEGKILFSCKMVKIKKKKSSSAFKIGHTLI